MKKILFIILIGFLLTGCFEEVEFSDTKSFTTLYPIKFATNYLYGKYSKVQSIYPNDIIIKDYELTKKQKTKYSDCETFVYSGLAEEGTIAKDLLNLNNRLQIIDATKGMNIINNISELWLDPSNYLMIVRNIKESLINYHDNVYMNRDIETNYDKIKEEISELDVMLYNLGKNGNYKTIITSNNLFNYLNKYSIETISLDPKADNLDKSYMMAKNKINSGEIKYMYVLKNEELNETITNFINEHGLEKIEINPLDNLTNEDSNNFETYITLMKKIIDEYKKELYK